MATIVWKRLWRSVRAKRDEEAFRAAYLGLQEMRATAASGLCDLYYYDEAGFSSLPGVPYAWQVIREPIELLVARIRRQNVLAFMGPKAKQFHPLVPKDSIDTHTVIRCFDTLSRSIDNQTWVVVDNAPTRTS